MGRFLRVILLASVLAVVVAAPAFAHAEVRERAPAAGQTLGGEIDHIDISFDGPIVAAEIALLGPDGEQIDVGETMIRRDGLITTVEFDALTAPGNYTVSHFELAADGDEQRAAFGFVYDPESEERLASLLVRDDGPNWLILGVIGAAVLVGVGLFAPRRK